MYEAFYGLSEKPFNLTPDPKYLYLSEKHKEAFAHLLFGIKNRSGFVMVTGEIGTGKTTICRNLLNQLDPNTDLAFIYNPALNPVELIKKINAEFGVDSSADNALDLSEDLNRYLLQATAEGKNCVLVIDEAQNLAPAVLEQIRLLSNLETEKEKLLQIILIGQPELGEKLALHELRQLNQRITARYHLAALNEQETRQYIAYRIHVAGGRKTVRFTKQAYKLIYKKSGGTPRVVNAICDRALLIGYTTETHTLTSAIVKRAAKEVRGGKISKRRVLQKNAGWVPSPGAIAIALALPVAAYFMAEPVRQLAQEFGSFNRLMTEDTSDTAQTSGALPVVEAHTENTDQTADASTAAASSTLPRKALEKVLQVQTPDPPEGFDETLAKLTSAGTRRAASAALLRAWNTELDGEYPADDEVATLHKFIADHGLAYETLSPALDQLLAVNLPAFVRVENEGKSQWLALLGVDGDNLRLTLEPGETVTTSREAFLPFYQNEAVVLWRDPAPTASALLPGRSGTQVAALKSQLRSIGRIAENNTNNTYDAETAKAVSRLQAETGLLVDGMAGRQVRMILASWSDDKSTPNLREMSADERVKNARVAPAVAVKKPAPKPAVKKPAPKPAAKKPAAATPAPKPAAPKPAPAPRGGSLTNPRGNSAPTAVEEAPAKPKPVATDTSGLSATPHATEENAASDVTVAAAGTSATVSPDDTPSEIAEPDDTSRAPADVLASDPTDGPATSPESKSADTGEEVVSVQELPEPGAPGAPSALSLPPVEDSRTAPAAGSAPLVPGESEPLSN